MIVSTWTVIILSLLISWGGIYGIYKIFRLDEKTSDWWGWRILNAIPGPILGPIIVMDLPFSVFIGVDYLIGPGQVRGEIASLEKKLQFEPNFENIITVLNKQKPYVKNELKDFLLSNAFIANDIKFLEKYTKAYPNTNRKEKIQRKFLECIQLYHAEIETSLWAECLDVYRQNRGSKNQYRQQGTIAFIYN